MTFHKLTKSDVIAIFWLANQTNKLLRYGVLGLSALLQFVSQKITSENQHMVNCFFVVAANANSMKHQSKCRLQAQLNYKFCVESMMSLSTIVQWESLK
jgi:hypothetical protein